MTCWLCGFETAELATNRRAPMCKGGCPTCTAVAKVDGEINEAVTTLQRLLDKRRDLRTEQNRAHDPMHRLPVEIRNHTFELVLPSWDEWGDSIQACGELPTHLSSVCMSWRDIAWANPFLWSTIRVAPRKMPTSGWFNFVHNWILRSGIVPLTFHLKIRAIDCDKEQSIKDLAAVMGTVSYCSNRLQSLSLEVPFDTLYTLAHSNLSWHRLTRLRILSPSRHPSQPLPFFNSTASPEKIELKWASIQTLRLSWNCLTSAKVDFLDLKDLAQLFQDALQMTECHISALQPGPTDFSMPQIIHHRLKVLNLLIRGSWESAAHLQLLNSLTVSCLQEFRTDNPDTLMDLPALVHRSSCSLTRLILCNGLDDGWFPEHFEPLRSVTDLVVKTSIWLNRPCVTKELLLKGGFPNLRCLTLGLSPFLSLWEMGVVHLLLDRKRLQPGRPNESRLLRFLVVEQGRALDFADMWKSDVGERLKALGISLREDGFEFL